MTKEEKIDILLNLIEEVEGVISPPSHFRGMSEEELDKEIVWYGYLRDK
ncbi:hypothetical protein BH753_gp075 [Bacillus phage Shbh1]|uniref:Uncharacterized protein n=1 Tax=Bacillus phage Shbh1 TaxID=1796992 RepID=A0A142F1A0_9CAUD|nr:hypothetical protein BH753_gp075 [Bacillus phage Shbh1]AMQ66557.1 hypothetical protein [Bacillus phage Shbh1]